MLEWLSNHALDLAKTLIPAGLVAFASIAALMHQERRHKDDLINKFYDRRREVTKEISDAINTVRADIQKSEELIKNITDRDLGEQDLGLMRGIGELRRAHVGSLKDKLEDTNRDLTRVKKMKPESVKDVNHLIHELETALASAYDLKVASDQNFKELEVGLDQTIEYVS